MTQLKRVLFVFCLLGAGLGAVAYSSSTPLGTDADAGAGSGAGSAGASGSAAVPNASTAGTGGGAPADGCIAEVISWGYNGGFFADAPCVSSSLGRAEFGPVGISGSCTKEVAGGAVSAGEIAAALEHVDVEAALAAAPVLYGRDTRSVDGTVFRITLGVGDVQIELGSDCDGQRACTPIPAGLQTLRELLEALTAQQRVDPDCYPKP